MHAHPGWPPIGTVNAYLGMLEPVPVQLPPPAPPLPAQPQANIEALGWMLCDGRPLEIAKYPELYGVLGTLYGGTPGHFNLPNCQGCFLRGVDYNAGIDPEARARSGPSGGPVMGGVGSTQGDAVISHTHSYTSHASAPGMAAADAPVLQVAPDPQPTGTPQLAAAKVSASETRPVNIAVNYIIRYR